MGHSQPTMGHSPFGGWYAEGGHFMQSGGEAHSFGGLLSPFGGSLLQVFQCLLKLRVLGKVQGTQKKVAPLLLGEGDLRV